MLWVWAKKLTQPENLGFFFYCKGLESIIRFGLILKMIDLPRVSRALGDAAVSILKDGR